MKESLTVVFLIMTGVCYSQAGYKIEGSVKGLIEGSKLYLIDGAQRKRIDSAMVINNRFSMAGKLSEAAFTYLYLGKTEKLADILLDNRNIEVIGNYPVYDSIKISGSEIDAQWKEWYKADQTIGYRKYRLEKVYQSLMDSNDLENASILKTLCDELMKDRINILKSHVRKYNDSPSGAVLPTLCSIQDNLKESDYLQMYNSLTSKMQSTLLGKEILKLAAADN